MIFIEALQSASSVQKPTIYLSTESMSQNQKTESQMMVSFDQNKGSNCDKIWEEPGFFNETITDLTISKPNFPENTLCYINQGTVSQIKDGEAIYLEYVVLGQIMVIANPDPKINLDEYEFAENECLLYVPLYNKENGLLQGLGKRIGYITLRGDKNDDFYSYGYDPEKSKLLFCSMKKPIPNIFQCTCFKKHFQFLLNEKATDKLTSSLFLFLPSMLDRKEKLNQFKDSVNLHPIGISYDDIKALNGDKDFDPSDLDHELKRKSITSVFYSCMKKIAETSNNNLIRNCNAFLSSSNAKIDPTSEFQWIDSSRQENQGKFQMSY